MIYFRINNYFYSSLFIFYCIDKFSFLIKNKYFSDKLFLTNSLNIITNFTIIYYLFIYIYYKIINRKKQNNQRSSCKLIYMNSFEK